MEGFRYQRERVIIVQSILANPVSTKSVVSRVSKLVVCRIELLFLKLHREYEIEAVIMVLHNRLTQAQACWQSVIQFESQMWQMF